MENIPRQASKALKLYERGQCEEALSIATRLTEQFPLEAEVWKLRADLYDKGGLTKEAVADLGRAIEIDPQERMYLFRRAFDHLRLGHWSEVIADCTLGLKLTAASGGNGLSDEDALGNEYYSDIFLSLRAEALLSLGRKREAKADLILLTEGDGNMWTNQLRTKSEMLRLCE